MTYYSKNTDVKKLINNGQGNDTNGSITGYKGFPISDSCPDSYKYERIPQPLGYKKNGTDLTQTSNGTSNCNAYNMLFTNTGNSNDIDISNYNYMSGVLVGGGGGGAAGAGSFDPGAGGGGGGSGAFYRVDISNYNTINITVGSGGNSGTNYKENGGSGNYSLLAISENYNNDYIRANAGGGGNSNNSGNNSANGGNSGNLDAYNIFSNAKDNNFNNSNKGNDANNNGDKGGNGGSVGNWNTVLANCSFGTGGNAGDTPWDNGPFPNSGNDYGGGGGGGKGTNEGDPYRRGAKGANGYVEIWLYKD